MHVVYLNFSYQPGLSTPGDLLQRFWSMGGWAEALAQAGLQVTVIQRFDQQAQFQQAGVTYHFLTDGPGADLRPWQMPRRSLQLARDLCRQSLDHGDQAVVHLNGLMYGLQARLHSRMLPKAVPLAAQHHAELPWQGPRAWVQRWGLKEVDGFLFSVKAYAHPWTEAGMIASPSQVFDVAVGSTKFRFQDRGAARRITGLAGDPLFLWVGRLNQNKAPLTVLAGFEQLLAHLPGARLAMAYGESDILSQVQHRIDESSSLAGAVDLLGRVPHADMEAIYNSAHYFLLGSHREGYGYALAEAMACGVVPIVTDIPSFRQITNDGVIGELWAPGRADALVEAALTAVARPWSAQSTQARRFFQDALSWSTIGRKARAVYGELIARRQPTG